MNYDFDLHIHTFRSPCGHDEMLPLDIVCLAVERGMHTIGITDHWYPTTDPKNLDDIRTEIADAQKTLGTSLRVRFGCEAEVMSPGVTSGSAELAEKLDFVMLGATHFVNRPMTVLPPGDDEFHGKYFIEMFKFSVSQPWADVIAHPFHIMTGVCSTDIFQHISDAELLPAIEIAKENNVAMEISRRVFTTPEQYAFSTRFLRLCKKSGLKFTLGSDAHQLQDLAQIHLLKPVVEELQLTEKDFWMPQ